MAKISRIDCGDLFLQERCATSNIITPEQSQRKEGRVGMHRAPANWGSITGKDNRVPQKLGCVVAGLPKSIS